MTEYELILTSMFHCRRIDLYVDKPTLTGPQQRQLDEILMRRKNGEPLQYILGHTEFMGLNFIVDPRVLIPRPETEILVEMVIKKASSLTKHQIRILDIGTGSGNIAVSLAKHLKNSHVVAIDISKDALDVARLNARKHGVEEQIDFMERDAFTLQQEPRLWGEPFDVIVSNPPYIPHAQMKSLPSEVQREPSLALNGGEKGLVFFQGILEEVKNFVQEGSLLFLELGDGQRSALEVLLTRYPCWQFMDYCQDYRGIDRIFIGQYTADG